MNVGIFNENKWIDFWNINLNHCIYMIDRGSLILNRHYDNHNFYFLLSF